MDTAIEPVIKLVEHPYSQDVYQARLDHAIVTGQPLLERPWWFEDVRNGNTYHELYGCLGWPSEVSATSLGLPGYIAIVGVIRPLSYPEDKEYNPRDAAFVLLEEDQDLDVPTLLYKAVRLRAKYGFGVQRKLLTAWYGDPERFLTALALYNERLTSRNRNPDLAIVLTPPEDFYTQGVFDTYVRALKSALLRTGGLERRLWLGNNEIIKTRLREFQRDDPAVLAVGGIVHTLLSTTLWMDRTGDTVFNVKEAV